MPTKAIDHSRLLPEKFRENPFWTGLTAALDAVVNPTVQGAVEQLGQLRSPDVEPDFANLNARMLGFRVPSLAFTDSEYQKLLRTLGTFWQTRGASRTFINYISYLKNVELVYADLWANSLDMPINQLTPDHGTELWNNGAWFPTSYYDIYYSVVDFPNIDELLFKDFINLLAPEHLVLRDLVGIEASTSQIYLTAIPLDRQYTTTIAKA